QRRGAARRDRLVERRLQILDRREVEVAAHGDAAPGLRRVDKDLTPSALPHGECTCRPGPSSRSGDRVTDVVSISVPAAPGWTGVVELVLAGLGARLDLPYDRIDELQLATTAVLEDAVGAERRCAS